MPASQTGPLGSAETSPRENAPAADPKGALPPQVADLASADVPSGAASEAVVATGLAQATPPPLRPVADAASPPAAMPLDLDTDAEWTERVSLDLSAPIDGPVRQLRFKLRPVTLGEMAISVERDRDQLRVALVVESPEAHAIVTRDLDQLRTAVHQQGLRLDHASVELGAPAGPAEGLMTGAGGWASQHRQPLTQPGEEPSAMASSAEARPQAPPRPVRTSAGGRIDVYA